MVWYRLRWPREVDEEHVISAFRLLAATAGTPVLIEVVGARGIVKHHLAVRDGRVGEVTSQLRTAIPGLAIEKLHERPNVKIDRAVEVRLSTRLRPLKTDDPAGTSRAVLTALAHVGNGESLTLRYELGRRLAATPVPNQLQASQSLVSTLLGRPQPPRTVDSDVRGALRAKRAEQGWQVTALLGVSANSATRQGNSSDR